MATTEQYVGQPVLRKEDAPLLTGQGTFVDNQTMSGMVMAAVSLIDHGQATSEAAIREGLEGNLCRCTGYHNIVAAVESAAGAMGRTS